MMKRQHWIASWLAMSAAAACAETVSSDNNADSGLPCEVGELLASNCQSCHGARPAGAPMSLTSHEDLVAPSVSDPSRIVVELCIDRMRNAAAPMPPGGLLAQSQVEILERWLAAGTPRGDCSGTGPGVVCSSNRYFDDFALENEALRGEMFPGRACIHCHLTQPEEEGPPFLVAGTVYPTPHEPIDCYGAAGARIVVTGAVGSIVEMTSNGAGNFYYEADPGALAMPIRARVEYQGRTRAMSQAVTTGDCNGCHTQDGDDNAPGRIQLP